MTSNRIKDLVGALILILTALLYFGDPAGAEAARSGDSTPPAVVVER